MPKLEVGAPAPEFKLQNENGEWITLQGLLQLGKPVMLVFYPGDFTPVCTKQLCGYQNVYDEIARFGVQIVGISDDPPESHQEFKKKHRFVFPLLSDPGKTAARSYGMTSAFMLGAVSRGNVIIGRDGSIIYRNVEAVAITHQKSDDVLETLGKLRKSGAI